MGSWEHYHLPSTVSDALRVLASYAGSARIVAGGTDLLLELDQGHRPPVPALVDVTGIPELTTVVCDSSQILIGAAVTHTTITTHPQLLHHAACLVESCGVIGGPQVRNVATLGGNVAHALPAGDGTLSLVALEAEAEIASLLADEVKRVWRPVRNLYTGPGRSAVDQGRELMVRFRVPPAVPGSGSAFTRVMRPQGVALPILGLAAWVRVDEARLATVRLALGPAGPTPLRATAAEAFLTGQPLDDLRLTEAADRILDEARLRTSPHRASADYRAELIRPLLTRALTSAISRATMETV